MKLRNSNHRTLIRTTDRAFQVLRAEGTDAAIRTTLQAAGFTEAERQRGWNSLHRLSNFVEVAAAPVGTEHDVAFRAADQAPDIEVPAFIRRARAALCRLHADVAATAFGIP